MSLKCSALSGSSTSTSPTSSLDIFTEISNIKDDIDGFSDHLNVLVLQLSAISDRASNLYDQQYNFNCSSY